MTPKLRVGLAAAAGSLALDQASKALALAGWLGRPAVLNPGGLFSLFPEHHTALIAIAVAGIGLVLHLLRRLAPDDRPSALALGLVLGGALGNGLDRVLRGGVVDFIAVQVTRDFAWPTFNLADAFVCVGTAWLSFRLAGR